MPLIKENLKLQITKIIDSSSPIHEGFPENSSEASLRWADAINQYASSLIPLSTTSSAAKTSLQAHLNTVPALGEQGFVNGLISYASVIATGMNPTFTGVVPPIPIVLTPAFMIGLSGGSSEDVASKLSDIIDVWFRTGTAINNSSGVVTNWN
jgi:hypothetical protein